MNNSERTQPARRNNGPASDDDNNINTSEMSATTPRRDHDGGAAEQQQPIAKNTKSKETKVTKTLWVTVFRCFFCGKHGHNLPKCRQRATKENRPFLPGPGFLFVG